MSAELTPELKLLQKAVGMGVEQCKTIMNNSFEKNPDPLQNNEFHLWDPHIDIVIERMVSDLELNERVDPGSISPRDVILAPLVGGSHDLVNNRTTKMVSEGEHTKKVVVRDLGNNEIKSSERAIAIMLGINAQLGEEIFIPYDMQIMAEAHLATIPPWNDELGTVVQPYLTIYSRPLVRVMAIGDIGSSGRNTAQFLEDGDRLFREEQIDILEALMSPEPMSISYKRYCKDRIVAWSYGQPNWAIGRQRRQDLEFAGFTKPVQIAMKRRYNQFVQSEEATRLVAQKREEMSPDQILIDIGYPCDSRAHLFNPIHLQAG